MKTNWLFIFIATILVGGGIFGVMNFATTGTISIPDEQPGKIYTPVTLSLICKTEGATQTSDTMGFPVVSIGKMLTTNGYLEVFNAEKALTCPANVEGGKCTFNIRAACAGNWLGSTTMTWTYNYIVSQNKMGEQNFEASPGATTPVRVSCDNSKTPDVTYTMTTPLKAIYCIGGGISCRNDKLVGGDNCVFSVATQSELKQIANNQPNDKPLPTEMRLGSTLSIIEYWDAIPVQGNVITYNKQPAVCKPFNSIYSLETVTLVDGTKIYKQKDMLASYSYSDASTMCCSTDECKSNPGYVCENFKCTKSPTTCSEGQCQVGERGTTKSYTETVGTKYYATFWSCNKDTGCVTTSKKEISCTKESCDLLTTYDKKYVCIYDKGCIVQDTLKSCSGNMCCETGSGYEVKTCQSGQTCCKEVSTNPLLGYCKTTCGTVIVENCNNGIDDDKDGWIDKDDVECAQKEVCTNNIDDDGDGKIDKDDSDCNPKFSWVIFLLACFFGILGGAIVYGYTDVITKFKTHNKVIDPIIHWFRWVVVAAGGIVVFFVMTYIMKWIWAFIQLFMV